MLTPDILFDSYRDITPAFLQSQGVTLLLTDLDYTQPRRSGFDRGLCVACGGK